ncbi:MAG: hypothetical protein F4223_07925 [Rhodobacteraceae bacterium]|nr:hypothetical protein [Paracoccaceae bacterium]
MFSFDCHLTEDQNGIRPRVQEPFPTGTCNNGISFDRHLTGSGKFGPDDGFQASVHGRIVVDVFI